MMMGDSATVADAGLVLCGSEREGSPVCGLSIMEDKDSTECIYWSINDWFG